MKTLDSAQEVLLGRPGIRIIDLVTLQTYSNKDAGTVDSTFRFASSWLEYDSEQWESLLVGVDIQAEEMPHLPDPEAGLSGALHKRCGLVLRNAERETGNRLIADLRADNLEGATVEWSQILLDQEASWSDLSGFAGTEHTVRYRGELYQITRVDDQEIELEFRTDEPRLSWLIASDASTVDPQDLGKRLPVVYGSAKRVPAIGYVVGFTTTLAETMTPTSTGNIKFTDVSGFASSGAAMIGQEQIVWSSKSDANNTLNITGRNQGGTTATDHAVGDVIIELVTTAIWVVAGHEVGAINDVYVENPFNRELVRLAGSGFTKTAADTSVLAGHTLATVRLTSAQLVSLIGDLATAAAVTQQPARSTDVAISATSSYDEQPTSGNGGSNEAAGRDGNSNTYNTLTSTGTWDGVSYYFPDHGTIIQQTVYFETGSITSGGSVYFKIGGSTVGGPYTHTSKEIVAFTTTINSNNCRVELAPGTPPGTWTARVYRVWRVATVQSSVTQQPQVAETGGTEVQISAASVGYGLRLYADVDGVLAPVTYAPGYAFDEGTGWSVDNVTQSSDTTNKTEGSASQKATWSLSPTVVFDFDDHTEWTVDNGSKADETTIKTEGTGSVKVTSNSSNLVNLHREDVGGADWTGKTYSVDVYVDSSASLSATDGIRIAVASDVSYTNFRTYAFGTNDGLVAGQWCTITFDPTSDNNLNNTGGTFDVTSVDAVMHSGNAVSPQSGRIFYWDNGRTMEYTGVMQRNATSGAVDLSAYSDYYSIDIRVENLSSLESLFVYFSNTAGSGTTKPASYKKVTIPLGSLIEGTFVTLKITATDVGSPSVDDVETIGLEMVINSTTAPSVWVDNLKVGTSETSGYIASLNDVLEEMPDILRHLLTERCTVPQTCESAWNDAGDASHLDDNVHACELTALGETFEEIAARLAFEARCNLTQEERASGTEWRLLCAESDYDWGASARTITKWQSFTEEGRALGTIRTRFLGLYDRRADRGGPYDPEAYGALVRIDPDQNDVSDPSTSDLEDAEAAYGRREAEPVLFQTINDEETAEEVLAYYAHERIRVARLYKIDGVPWTQAFDLERGDRSEATPPWEGSPRKLRILSVVKDPHLELVDIGAVEVG